MLARPSNCRAGLLILDAHLANLARLDHKFKMWAVDEGPSAL